MKYNPDAYLEYPILRPNSTDYPEGHLTTKLSRTHSDSRLNISLAFEVEEPAICRQIEKGDAVCCALLYCRTSCYSEMLQADSGSTVISASVPLGFLTGRVEVHPSVITTDNLAIRAETVHPEYGTTAIPVNKHRQLAMDEPWHFAVGFIGAIESVFHWEQDERADLENWEFEFDTDPGERHIVIRANRETFQACKGIRQQVVNLTKATVYLNALTTALADLRPDSDDNELAEGWAATIRAHMDKQNIRWPEFCSSGLAAQRLLNRPLDYLPETVQERYE